MTYIIRYCSGNDSWTTDNDFYSTLEDAKRQVEAILAYPRTVIMLAEITRVTFHETIRIGYVLQEIER